MRKEGELARDEVAIEISGSATHVLCVAIGGELICLLRIGEWSWV